MKGYLRAKILLSAGAALSAMPSVAALKVRNIDLDLPFKLRILIRDFENESFEVAGLELHDELGRKIPGEVLSCDNRYRQWTCRAGSYQRALSTPLRLKVRAGFINVGFGKFKGEKASFFRDEVILHPRANGRVSLVNNVEMDSYLAGLINSEIRSDYPREAIKAQAIAARSYAIVTAAERRRAHEFFDLYGSEMDQVYQGSHLEDARSYRIVHQTKGLVLVHGEDLLKAYYHSSSGGHSELPDNVWENSHREADRYAYLARPSPVDSKVKGTEWKVSLSPKIGLAWPGIGLLRDFKILERSKGMRVRKILVEGSEGSQTMSGTALRSKLGPRWLKSTLFFVKKNEKGWLLEGRGFGHGVGLSQLGARDMAYKGTSFTDILSFYYPYANIRRVDLDKSEKALKPRPASGPAPSESTLALRAR